MTENQNIDKEIAQVITSLATTFRNQDDAEYHAKFLETFGDEMVSPSKFYDTYSYPAGKEKDTFVRLMVERVNPFYAHQEFLVKFIYSDYAFVKRFLSQQVSHYEGSACSVDKARSLITLIVASIVNELYPMPKEQVWHLPEVDSLILWMDLIQSLCYFSHGQPEKYLIANAALESFYAQRNDK